LIFKRFPEIYKVADRKIYDTKFKYAVNNADLIIAISEQTKRDIIEFYGIKSEKIKVLYQTCHHNFKKEYTVEEKEQVRVKFNLPDEFVLNVGTIEKRKNLNTIVNSLALLNPTTLLVVVGKKTGYYQEVLKEIEKLGLMNRIHFLENVSIEELPMIYQLASVFVYPSIFEGFGIPIIEALYSVTPVISSKGGCFTEAGGENSIYVDPKNENELAAAINKILTDKVLSDKMKLKGRAYAVSMFDEKILSKQLMDIYLDKAALI